MRVKEGDVLALRTMAAMPFLDWLELAAVSGLAVASARRALMRLQKQGLVQFLRHGSPLIAATRRWHLTPAGLERLAGVEGQKVDGILRLQPVSAHWQRLLLERLDAVAIIYRLASAVASVEEIVRFRWYRSLPLDAAMTLSGGKTLGVLRQGATVGRAAFADRVNWLVNSRQSLPRGLLALMPDDSRLQEARRLLARYPGPAFLALEQRLVNASANERVWRIPSLSSMLSLEEVLSNLGQGGGLPHESPLSRASLPNVVSPPDVNGEVPNHLLSTLLGAADKQMLDCLSDWPWAAVNDLCAFLGVSDSRVWRTAANLESLMLAVRATLNGRKRWALGRRGLAMLARRDRASVSTSLRRWQAEPDDGGMISSWRDVPGGNSRTLARTIEHTEAVHWFLAALLRQAKRNSETNALRVCPPHRSTHYFPHGNRLRSIHPDASGAVGIESNTIPFFLEWERRAVHPSTMADRLAPYLRYYSSKRPLDDHGAWPLVLIVFDDYLAEGVFLGVARREMERAKVDVPLWVSHKERLEQVGPLGLAWRNPDALEPTCPFT